MKSAFAVLAVAGTVSGAAAQSFIDPNLPGTTDFDGWDNLTVSNPQVANANPAFPDFLTAANPWPEAIESVLTQGTPGALDDDATGNATFDKTSGFGYPASVSIYSTPFGNGTYNVSDDDIIAGLETVVFQIRIGEGSAGTLAGDPTLTINGTTTVPLFEGGSTGIEIIPNPFGGGTIGVPTFGYQWDVSGLGPINSIDVDFDTAGTSTTIFALQLDQGSQFVDINIPTPGSLALLGMGGLVAARRRR
ncbi:MAG: PEP-CTERM sorting domain-containing protein [Planctomycetota bacterium]